MGEQTGISWCDHTFNPWIGCTEVSPACDGCYARVMMQDRYGRVKWGGERKRTSASNWLQPRAWNRAAATEGVTRFVFCASLADVFDNQVPDEWRADLFNLIRDTPNLIYLLLTKRPQNIIKLSAAAGGLPSNAALGATCEDQERADRNVPALLLAKEQTRARFAFVSIEPMLGPVNLSHINVAGGWYDALAGWRNVKEQFPGIDETLDWVIAGGETDQGKHKARPSDPQWFRWLRNQCQKAGTPFHFKQWGEWADIEDFASEEIESFDVRGLTAPGVVRVGKKRSGRELDGVIHDAMPRIAA